MSRRTGCAADETDYVTSAQRDVQSRLPAGTEQAALTRSKQTTARQTIAADKQTTVIQKQTAVAGKKQTTAARSLGDVKTRRLSSSLTSLVTSMQSGEESERNSAGRILLTSETQDGEGLGGGLREVDRQRSRNKRERIENQRALLLNKMSSL